MLAASRTFGHGNRVLRPALIWTAVAVALAIVISSLHSRISGPSLALDLWLSPLTFLRPAADGSPIAAAIRRGGDWVYPAIQLARTLGTVCFVFLAFAVRSYTRLGRGHRDPGLR